MKVTIKASIIVESDEVTDANVKKKQEKAPHVGLNKRWTLKQLYVLQSLKLCSFSPAKFIIGKRTSCNLIKER